MPPLPTQAQPQRARGRRPSGVCLLGQPRSRASHLPLGRCLDADKATADRGLRAPYLAQTYPDDHRHPRVGEDAAGQHPGQHYLNLPIVVLFIMSSSGCPNSAGTEDEHRGSAA